MDAIMEDVLKKALAKLHFVHTLKEEQRAIFKMLYKGKDCIGVLPTGYGKSIIFQALPWVLQKEGQSGIVIVVCPLTSIIHDQVRDLKSKGVRASFINIVGSKCLSFIPDPSDYTDHETERTFEIVTSDITTLEKGDVDILYTHPEALFTRNVGKILRSDEFRKRVCCVAVDEVHIILEWGDDFRPMFKNLGELKCLFPTATHLAVTATATEQSTKDLGRILQYRDPEIVRVNPDRPNIYLEIIEKPHNIDVVQMRDFIVETLAQELLSKMESFPLTIVYVESLEALGYYYNFVHSILGKKQYVGTEIPENRMFAQYHKDSTEEMKLAIISDLQKPKPILRLVFATEALGMGVNAPSVVRIIHCRPPLTMEKYVQQIGRAGRNGEASIASMYCNNRDLTLNRKGLTNDMVTFCRNRYSCLRKQLLSYFGFQTLLYIGDPKNCCMNCRNAKKT